LPQGGNWQKPVDTSLFLWYPNNRYGVIMSIKLALLKSGEQIIADIKEYVDQNEKVISLLFENPYIVKFLTAEFLVEGIENEEVSHKVSFSPWIVMSEDKSMSVPIDWLVTIVEPIDWVKKSYEEKMNQSVDGIYEDIPTVEPSIFQNVDSLEDLSLEKLDAPKKVVNVWEDAICSEQFKSNEVIVEGKDGEQ
jgi:hypothetical protein